MNLHWFESRTDISSLTFILVPSCQIRTAYASAGLLASEVFFGSFDTEKNRHKHRRREIFSRKSDHLTGGREIHRPFVQISNKTITPNHFSAAYP